MAITLRATNSGNTGGAFSPVNVTLATGTATNDLVLVAIYLGQASSTITPPSGWTQIGSTLGPTGFSVACFYHTQGSGDTTTPTFSYTPGNNISQGWVTASYIGVNASPLDGTPTTATSAAATNLQIAAFTLANAASELVGIWFSETANQARTRSYSGSIYTLVEEVSLNAGNFELFSLADKPATATGTTGTVTATDSAGTPVWAGFFLALLPAAAAITAGARKVYLPQYQHRLRHQFSNPRHVRIYHPKPAQYETLLVPVRVRPRPQIYRKRWKLPAGWRAAEKFKGRLWHWPQEFMTLLVPVKPRPVPFRTRIHWKLPTDIRENVLKRLKRPGAFFVAAALPKFRTRVHWKLPAGWRERLRFPVKYRPAEFMTLLVPIKLRPFKPTQRARWQLDRLGSIKLNILKRLKRPAPFDPNTLNAPGPKLRTRKQWKLPHWQRRYNLKYRPTEFMTVLVPVKLRPFNMRLRSHWQLARLGAIRLNILKRLKRPSPFSTSTLFAALPKFRTRIHWKLPSLRQHRVAPFRRILAAAIFIGVPIRRRTKRVLHGRGRKIRRQIVSPGLLMAGIRPRLIRLSQRRFLLARRRVRAQRLAATLVNLAARRPIHTRVHPISRTWRSLVQRRIRRIIGAIISTSQQLQDIARWRFQRRNIGSQGRVRSSGKHGDV